MCISSLHVRCFLYLVDPIVAHNRYSNSIFLLYFALFVFYFFSIFFFLFFFFFFQAEDGIRDLYVTGVQTCALPISSRTRARATAAPGTRPRRGPRTPA